LLDANALQIAGFATEVAAVEGPIHESLLLSRIADIWGQRLGSRIRSHIEAALAFAVQRGLIGVQGEFYSLPTQQARIRTGRAAAMGAEHVHSDELRLAVRMVLASRAVAADAVILAVRDLLGVSIGSASREAVDQVLGAMRAAGEIADGPTGLVLRR